MSYMRHISLVIQKPVTTKKLTSNTGHRFMSRELKLNLYSFQNTVKKNYRFCDCNSTSIICYKLQHQNTGYNSTVQCHYWAPSSMQVCKLKNSHHIPAFLCVLQ